MYNSATRNALHAIAVPEITAGTIRRRVHCQRVNIRDTTVEQVIYTRIGLQGLIEGEVQMHRPAKAGARKTEFVRNKCAPRIVRFVTARRIMHTGARGGAEPQRINARLACRLTCEAQRRLVASRQGHSPECTHMRPERMQLIARLRRTKALQLRRSVPGQHHQRDARRFGLHDSRIIVRHGASRRADNRRGTPRRLRQTQRDEGRTALVHVDDQAQPLRLALGQLIGDHGQRR